MASGIKRIGFGEYEFDPATGEIIQAGEVVKLQPQPARVLQLLLSKQGQLVTREELREALWPDGTSVEFDQGLHYSIRQIRSALGESASAPEFIETLPKKGYRFIAPLESQKIAKRMPGWQAGLAIGLLLVGAGWLWSGWTKSSPAKSLLVRPFVTLGLSEKDSWYGDAITQQLIGDLARVQSLRVLPWSTTLSLRGQNLTAAEAGQRFGAEVILEGSIRAEGERLLVSAQLVEAKTERTLWSFRDERPAAEFGRIEDSVLSAMARALSFRITEGDTPRARRRPEDIETYNLYLKAISLGDQFSRNGSAASVALLEDVIRREPGFAPAYARLAHSLVMSVATGGPKSQVVLDKAIGLARRAIALDPSYGESHTALAHALFHSWKWKECEEEFLIATGLDPNSALTAQLYGIYLATQRRFPEAIRSARRSVELAPTSGLFLFTLANILMHAGRYEEGLAVGRTILEIDRGFLLAHNLLVRSLLREKRLAEAEERLKRWEGIEGVPSQALWRAQLLALRGDQAGARKLLADWEKRQGATAARPIAFALALLRLGERERGLEAIQGMVANRVGSCVWLAATPEFAVIRSDPRFQAALRRVGLPGALGAVETRGE